jgi:CRP/FNR family cyclic AMP-dependent transcriptional regulator
MSQTLSGALTGNCKGCQVRLAGGFCSLATTSSDQMESLGRTVILPSGATPIHQGGRSEFVVILCQGQMLLSCVSREGRRMNLKVAQPGEILGLSAAISSVPFEATARTLTPARIKIIETEQFLNFLKNSPKATSAAMVSLSQHYSSAISSARSLSLPATVAGRIATLFLEWGRPPAGSIAMPQFTMAFSHDELADFAATTRETVTRTLSQFQKTNLIEIRGVSVRILSPDRLSELAESA